MILCVLKWILHQKSHVHSITRIPNSSLGKDPATKSDEFLEKFQTAFDPPSFLESYNATFIITNMLAFMQGGIGQIVLVNIS